MMVLGELSALVTRIPAHYQLMGVKGFQMFFVDGTYQSYAGA